MCYSRLQSLSQSIGRRTDEHNRAANPKTEGKTVDLVLAVPVTVDERQIKRVNMATAIYCRTSKEYKNVERISISQQKESAAELAKARNLGDCKEYIDEDRSGALPPMQYRNGERQKTRESLTALIADIEAGKISTVIVRKIDRLARGVEITLRLLRLFKERKVRLFATHENLPGADDASGMFTLTILSAAAEFELDKMKSNVRAAKAYARKHDLKMGGKVPTGYAHGKDKTVVVDPEESKIVAEIFKRYIAGESMRSIGKAITEAYPSPKRGQLYASQVNSVLTSFAYIGMREIDDKLEPSKIYPAIIDPTVFWRAQEIINGRKGLRYGKYTKSEPHLLSGLLKCGCCGRNVQWARERSGDFTGRCSWPHTPGFRQFRITEQLWIEWVESFFAPMMIKETAPLANPERALLSVQLEKLNQNILSLQTRFATGQVDADLLANSLELAGKERQRLSDRLRTLPPESPTPNKTWATFTFDEKRAAVLSMIQRIDVFKDKVVVTRHCGKNKTVVFPLMKRLSGEFRVKAKNCLTPRLLTVAESVDVLHGTEVDWSDFVDERFYKAGERVRRDGKLAREIAEPVSV